MALGIAELVLLGLLFDWIFRLMKLPGLIGLLFLGVLMGPYGFNSLNVATQNVAADLRLIALIVILLRAGFEMSWEALSKVGTRAMLMAFIPCVLEVAAITIFGPMLLPITRLEAAMLGGVLAAVSPAVVVPLMIRFIEEGRGADKNAPTLILAGASVDDAVAIVLCTSFVGIYVGESVNLTWQIFSVPASVITGIIAGLLIGTALFKLFDRLNPRATKRVLIILGVSILLLNLQKYIEHMVPFAALLSIMAVGFIILEKREHAAHEISSKLGKIWVFAQLLLFALVGTQVNVPVAVNAGLAGAAVIAVGLTGREIGVQLCLLGSHFNLRERLFIGISYLPKATVQAAIGATPLMAMKAAGMNTQPGELILAIAVLSILLTAPTGAFLISWAGKKWLKISDRDLSTSPARMAALESEVKD